MRSVTDTNPNIKTEQQLIKMVAENIVSSFKIEGIELDYDQVFGIVQEISKEDKENLG